jgi:hypothetical protein
VDKSCALWLPRQVAISFEFQPYRLNACLDASNHFVSEKAMIKIVEVASLEDALPKKKTYVGILANYVEITRSLNGGKWHSTLIQIYL